MDPGLDSDSLDDRMEDTPLATAPAGTSGRSSAAIQVRYVEGAGHGRRDRASKRSPVKEKVYHQGRSLEEGRRGHSVSSGPLA